MKSLFWLAAGVACGFLLGASGPATAQVVQLPSYGVTSVATTVSVPDRGSAYLGGVGRASSGRVERGVGPGRLLGNRAFGAERSAMGVRAHATIIDHAEWDAAILAEAAASRGAAPATSLTAKAAFLSRHVARHRADATSPADLEPGPAVDRLHAEVIAESNASARAQRQSESEQFFEQGRAAETAGRRGAAKVYYQMAARRATGELANQIAVRLNALEGAPPVRMALRSER